MKITKIKDEHGKKLGLVTLTCLAKTIEYTLSNAGYITEATVVNSSRIDLQTNQSTFKIDTTRLGYNARYSPCCSSKKGYRRTSVPTWEQRVNFNNLLNKVLTNYSLSANIKAMEFVIREGTHEFEEWDWTHQKETWRLHNEGNGHYVDSLPHEEE